MSNILDNEEYIAELKEASSKGIDWKVFNNKKILLSGATGLLGRFFVDLIMYKNIQHEINCKIIAISRKKDEINKYFDRYLSNENFEYKIQDVTEKIDIENDIDYIVHAASNTSPTQYALDPIGTILTNVYGTKNLLDLAVKKTCKKFIFVSSFEVYGKVEKEEIFENDFGIVNCTVLRSCYPESKRLSESLCEAYSEQKNVDISIVRLARVFGPTMNLNSTLATAQFIKNGINDEDVVLKSDGMQKYSFNYVSDAVLSILITIINGKNKEAYNVADEKYNVKLRDFAESVAKISGKNVIFDVPNEIEKKGQSNSTMSIMNGNKLKEIGWQVDSNMTEKIEKTIRILKNII